MGNELSLVASGSIDSIPDDKPINSPDDNTALEQAGLPPVTPEARELIRISKQRWQTADAASRQFRDKMRKDQRFANGNGFQWEAEDRTAREQEGRPCLEINRIPQFLRQVSNQNRANRSSITIHAKGSGATLKLAEAVQGLVRGVEVESDADVAYDTATDHQLISGLGFVRLAAQWADDEAFEQVCRIRRIRNPLSVYWDPATQEADFADARWMHVIGVIGKDEYESRWGKFSGYQSMGQFLGGTPDFPDDWMPEGKVIIAEYFYVEHEDRVLCRMDTGRNVWEEEVQQYVQLYALSHPGEPMPQVERKRQVNRPVVRWCIHDSVRILEGNEDNTAGRELPGTRIPLFPLIGTEQDLDGTVDYKGMVRDAIDPQRMYNFWSSNIAEAVALAPKAPWVAAKGQIEQYMEDWNNANRQAKTVLLYDPKAVGDVLVPPPTRLAVEPAIQAMVSGLRESNQDLMSVMGLFQPSLGQASSSTESGKAREALQQQGVIANSNFLDNLQRLKRSLGRALLEWLPVIYDVPRVVHLVQTDGKKKPAVVFAGAENKPSEDEFPDVSDFYDLSMGRYDVTVSTGPSYQTERQATEAWLLELFKVLPGLAGIGADIVLENSDHPAAQQLAKRAKAALPPQFQEANDPEAMLPQLMQQNAQMKDLLGKANQAIGAMAKTLESKELEVNGRTQVAIINAFKDMAVAQSKLLDARDQMAFQVEADRFAQAADHIQQQALAAMNQDAAERAAETQQVGSLQQIAAQNAAAKDLASHQQAIAPPPAANGGQGQ